MALDKVQAMLAYWDADQRCRFATHSYERWFGLGPQALVGQHIRDLLGPLYERDLPHIQGVLQGEPQMFEHEIPDPAGGPARPSLARYVPDKRDGTVRGFFVLLSDLSMVKGAAQPPRQSKEQDDITARERTEQEQLFLSELGPALASSFDEDEIIGQVARLSTRTMADFCIVASIESGDRIKRKQVAGRAASGESLVEAMRLLSIDSTRPHILFEAIHSKQAVLLQQPEDETLAALSQDCEQLRLFKALEIASSLTVPLVTGERVIGAISLIATTQSREYDDRDVRLAREVAARTAVSLENARLYRAACQATKERNEVLAIAAHDLRNPLNTIAVQAALLSSRAQPGDSFEAMAGETIQRSVARMARLIEDLLDASRMEAGRLAVEPACVDTNAFLSECVASQQPLARAAGLDLRLQVRGALPAMWADRDRLSQVFENLIGNALKFSGAGSQITVSAAVTLSEVSFSVCDSGAGILSEHLPYVFDRFWQARQARPNGAGLGLSIVKGIVEAHGGRAWVESTPGKGACFFFTIPRADGTRPGQQASPH